MYVDFIQKLELDILQIKRDKIALEIIESGKPGEFTRKEENTALAKLMASCSMLASTALVPAASLMLPGDPKAFDELLKKISLFSQATALNAEEILEKQNG